MTVVWKLLRGGRLVPAAAFCFLLLAGGATAALAQRLPQGTGGGAGHAPITTPGIGGAMPAAPAMKPAMPGLTPQIAPVTPVVPAAPSAAVPAPIIRFRCEVPTGQNTCKEPVPADGGADDTCDCTRDLCYKDASGARICEKP